MQDAAIWPRRQWRRVAAERRGAVDSAIDRLAVWKVVPLNHERRMGWLVLIAGLAAGGASAQQEPPEAPPASPPADAAIETESPSEAADSPPTVLEGPTGVIPPLGTLGFAGKGPYDLTWVNHVVDRPTVALPDRWRIGWPEWDRYGRQAPSDPLLMNVTGGDSPYTLGNPLNPYDRNVLKGDYPVAGDDIFLTVTAVSDTLFQQRKLPTPSGASAENAGSFDFFGDGEQLFINQTGFLSFDLFQGATVFRPVDWLLRVSPAFNVNYLHLQERNNTNINVLEGDTRTDSQILLQEAFFEFHLGDVSPNFDFVAAKAGRQLFVSDFRGFIFNDVSDGVRLFGNADSNRVQWNIAAFIQPEKNTNSELNELEWRDQGVFIANLYVQDFIWQGYTTQFSAHWNHDRSDTEYDRNGFLVRPSLAGSVTLQDIDAVYLGWAGDGHIDRLNINHAAYYATGRDGNNPIAGRSVDISAFLGAIELSVDIDWLRPKIAFVYASGDSDPTDGTGGGFDGIMDNPSFAGGASSFFVGQGFRLFGVQLTSPRSLYNDLAGAKAQGQSNFVNPGTMLLNIGLDMEITPKLRASINANSVWFANTGTLELFLNQNDIASHFGGEVNLLVQYRPLLNNNIILTGGVSGFLPGEGFEDLYGSDDMLYQAFVGVTLVY